MTVTLPAGSNITKLKLLQSTLVDTDSPGATVIHTDNFHLSADRSQPCNNGSVEVDLAKQNAAAPGSAGAGSKPGNTPAREQTIWLCVDDGFKTVGTFTGSLFFNTGPLTDMQTINLKIQQTRLSLQLLGVAIIIVGVAIAWLVTVFARSRIARDQALMPALALTQSLQDLQATENKFPPELQSLATGSSSAIQRLLDTLRVTALDAKNFLPPAFPAFAPSATQTTAYQVFLTNTSAQLADLDVIVNEGLQLLAQRFQPTLPAPDVTALNTAFSTIDGLSENLTLLPQAVRDKVTAAIQTFNSAHAVTAQALNVQAQAIAPAAPGQPTFLQVRLEVQTITMLFWLVWGLLSVVIGATVLIVPMPGFGSLTDFVRCFLWGFGLPVAGNSIQSLTTGSLNTQLGVSLTRSTT
jgi:type II secretory pathway pseudopilin PulG